MSFIQKTTGAGFEAGFFLFDDENCVRETREIAQSGASTINDEKIVKAGTIYPANDNTAIGIVYEDVNVTSGNMPGSVVTQGKVYKDRLPVAIASAAQSALEAKGFVFVASAPGATRPY